MNEKQLIQEMMSNPLSEEMINVARSRINTKYPMKNSTVMSLFPWLTYPYTRWCKKKQPDTLSLHNKTAGTEFE